MKRTRIDYKKQYGKTPAGSTIPFSAAKYGGDAMRAYWAAGTARTALLRLGITSQVRRIPDGAELQVTNNPNVRTPPPVLQPPEPPPVAVACPTPLPRASTLERDARSFFAEAFVHCLAMNEPKQAYALACQAEELYRRHITPWYKDVAP